jgi:uncharacterized protein YaiE (UPF0345 family)
MEDQPQPTHTPTYPSTETVGFPPQSQPAPKKGFLKWIIIAILGLLLIGGAAFFVLQGGDDASTPLKTPTVQGIDFVQTPSPTVAPAVTPEPVNKEGISVELLNGTGIGGEAGYLETQLKSLGYTDIKTGNASGAVVSVTTITFNTSVSETVVSEITKKLEDIYKQVETKTSSNTGSYDVKIIVGLRKGATPKPSTASTPKASTSSSPKASSSPTSSPSSTPKPTATP